MHLLVVGSSLIDLFVDLNQNEKVKLEHNNIILEFGDKIPVGIKALSLGGNGGNVAAGVKKLGITTSFYTYLGGDILSNYVSEVMKKEEVDVIREDEEGTTGSLSIILSIADDRTILSHHNHGNHSFDKLKVTSRPDYIFLTSIGTEWVEAYRNVVLYATENNIPIALSPGSAQMGDMNDVLLDAVHKSKILFCNLQEAQQICEKLSGVQINDPKELLLKITEFGFDLISVTDGGNGAYALTNSDKAVYKIPTMKPQGSEKTGAGDAYAAGFLASYLNSLPIEECMKRGVLNALGVMSNIGAHTGQLRLPEIEQKSKEIELKAERI